MRIPPVATGGSLAIEIRGCGAKATVASNERERCIKPLKEICEWRTLDGNFKAYILSGRSISRSFALSKSFKDKDEQKCL